MKTRGVLVLMMVSCLWASGCRPEPVVEPFFKMDLPEREALENKLSEIHIGDEYDSVVQLLGTPTSSRLQEKRLDAYAGMTEVRYALVQFNQDNFDIKDESIELLFNRDNKLVSIGLDKNSRECDADDYQRPKIATKPFEEMSATERKVFEEKLLQIHIGDTCDQVEKILGPATKVSPLQAKGYNLPIRGTMVTYSLFEVEKNFANINNEDFCLIYDNDRVLVVIHLIRPNVSKAELRDSEPKKNSRKADEILRAKERER